MIYADKWQPKGFGDVKTSFNLDLDVAFNMHYATWDGETLKVDAFGGKDLYLWVSPKEGFIGIVDYKLKDYKKSWLGDPYR